MKVGKWNSLQLLEGPQREEFEQLRDLVLKFQLSLDYRQWRRSDWLEKGSSYALLRKAYDMMNTYEYRCRIYALSFLYDSKLQQYISDNSNYLRTTEIEEVLCLLRIHADGQAKELQPDPTTTTETVHLGFRKEPTRFSRFTDMIGQLLKEKGCSMSNQRELRQYCQGLWRRIIEASGPCFRQERQEQVANELLRSLKYERMRMQLVRELMQQQKQSRNESVGFDFRGSLLREVINKRRLDQLQQDFSRFNRELYKKEKIRERFAEEH